jgi:hypothetical protein
VVTVAYRAHNIVLDPDGFFGDESDSPRLWVPAVVVLLIGVVRVAQSLYVSDYATSALEAGGNGPARGGVGGGMRVLFTLPSLIAPFVSWLVVAALITGICVYLGGEGGGSETVAVTGWGFFPALVGAVVTFAVTFYLLSGTNPSGMQEAIDAQQTVFEVLRSTQMRAFGYVIVGWQAFLWTFGVRHVQNLELRKAAVPAVIAGALVVAWDLVGTTIMVRVAGVLF